MFPGSKCRPEERDFSAAVLLAFGMGWVGFWDVLSALWGAWKHSSFHPRNTNIVAAPTSCNGWKCFQGGWRWDAIIRYSETLPLSLQWKNVGWGSGIPVYGPKSSCGCVMSVSLPLTGSMVYKGMQVSEVFNLSTLVWLSSLSGAAVWHISHPGKRKMGLFSLDHQVW